ncbi:MAG: hypothetical protein JWP42_2717 [Pseudomonas sp.]|nr:hypothetical protein [Pseudomonas sp.]
MVVNGDAFILDVREVFEFIASKLAPTGEGGPPNSTNHQNLFNNLIELINTKSVFIVIKISTYSQVIPSFTTTVKSLMNPTANIIDFTLYRKRKQAQQRARAMWELYARNAGLQAYQWVQAAQSTETRQA